VVKQLALGLIMSS